MPSILEGVFSSSEDELNKMLVSLVGMPKDQIESELAAIKSRVEEVAQTIPTKGNKGDKGDKGDQGIQGPKGEPGRDGRDGFIGKDGKQGVDGKDGLDGKDGVSIVDVNVAFDNHLVVTLSDGTEIDAGVIGSLNENLQNVVANYVSNGANGTLIYKGLWNASTNTPTLSLSSSDAGAYYVVSVAGSTNLSGITDWQVNDWAIFNGTAWQKIDNSDLFNPSAVAITGGAIDGTTIGSTTASTGKFTSVTTPSVTATTTDLTLSAISTGVVNLNTLNGTGLRLSELTGGTVNTGFGIFSGTSSQNTVYATPYGTFANSNMYLASKGSGNLFLGTNSNNSSTATTQTLISHTASAVNYVQVTGGATTAAPVLSSQGSDSNIALSFVSKGTARHNFFNNGATSSRQFAIGTSGITTAVNFLNVDGSVAGNALPIQAIGTDTNISMAFQPKGTGAIDLAAGSSGVNISNGGTVTAITRTATGSNYTSFPSIAISAPTTAGGVQATASTGTMFATGATIVAGGTGYTLNDVVTLVGGTAQTVGATYTVTGVSGGVVTAVTPLNYAIYTALPTNPVSVTGGTGTGLTLTVSWNWNSATITNAGSGYIEQPTITFSGGGGSGAAAYASVGSSSIIRALSGGANGTQALSIHTSGGETIRITDSGGTNVNFWRIQGASTNSAPQLQATGSDTNVSGLISSRGTGQISFYTNGFNQEQLRVSHTASAVNYVQVTGGATGNLPIISTAGSDASVGMELRLKGTPTGPGFRITNNNGSNACFAVTVSGSAPANYIRVDPAATTLSPAVSAQGSDTNIDLALTPKGTGLVRFGTYVAGALTATGYINIKAADGTTYKVLVST